MVVNVFGDRIDAILCSNVSSYQLGYSCCVFFLFFFFCGQNAEICLWSLRFAVPAGSNKLQTCFLSSNSTSAAPSLRHRPYDYPRDQQKMPLQSCVGGISLLPSVSRLYQESLCGRDLNAQNHNGNPHL